jgi:hypothetical protein
MSIRLWDAFEGDVVKTLRESPEEAAACVQGLSVAKAEAASKWLKDHARFEESFIEVNSLLSRGGFPKSTSKKAIKEWGAKAAETIYRNPYILQKFRGIGFKRCDALYCRE